MCSKGIAPRKKTNSALESAKLNDSDQMQIRSEKSANGVFAPAYHTIRRGVEEAREGRRGEWCATGHRAERPRFWGRLQGAQEPWLQVLQAGTAAQAREPEWEAVGAPGSNGGRDRAVASPGLASGSQRQVRKTFSSRDHLWYGRNCRRKHGQRLEAQGNTPQGRERLG